MLFKEQTARQRLSSTQPSDQLRRTTSNKDPKPESPRVFTYLTSLPFSLLSKTKKKSSSSEQPTPSNAGRHISYSLRERERENPNINLSQSTCTQSSLVKSNQNQNLKVSWISKYLTLPYLRYLKVPYPSRYHTHAHTHTRTHARTPHSQQQTNHYYHLNQLHSRYMVRVRVPTS